MGSEELVPTRTRRSLEQETDMVHLLLVLAAIFVVIWLVFHALGGLVNLLWIGFLIALGVWLFGFLRRRLTHS